MPNNKARKEHDEIMVSAFVEIPDVLKAVSTSKLVSEILERDLSDEDAERIAEKLDTPIVDSDDYDDDECDCCNKLEFESLQHQELYEEFEEARKNVNPTILLDLLYKLNGRACAQKRTA